MKTLLRGGPLDGKVVETSRTQFGYGEATEVSRRDTGREVVISVDQVYYEGHHLPDETHPCKKRGKVRVFKYMPDGRGA